MLEIEKMMALPGLRWDGILVYPGHIMGNRLIREQDIKHENETMDALRRRPKALRKVHLR